MKRIREESETGEYIIEKGDMDVEMTIDVMGHIESYDTVVFFTGDSDLLALVAYLRNKGKKVCIFSSENNISRELKTGSDGYFEVKCRCLGVGPDTKNENNPPQGGLLLDVVPFQLYLTERQP